MKNFDLNKYGVQEMNMQEMETTEGGIWGLILLFIIGLAFGLAQELQTEYYNLFDKLYHNAVCNNLLAKVKRKINTYSRGNR